MLTTTRDLREVIRDEHLMRGRILRALESGPLTIPEIAEAIGKPTQEAVFWVMGMRKYGQVTPLTDATDDGFFQYQAVARRQA